MSKFRAFYMSLQLSVQSNCMLETRALGFKKDLGVKDYPSVLK